MIMIWSKYHGQFRRIVFWNWKHFYRVWRFALQFEIRVYNTFGRKAYRIKTWKFDPRGIEQCRDGLTSEIEERALKEGCRIYGYLEVNRVGGSFHIAPGKSFIINHIHVHDVNPFSSTDFNVTHQIKHLSFGQQLDLGNR